MSAAQIAKLVDRGLVLVSEIEIRKAELAKIEKMLKSAALEGEHAELKDAAREGRRYLARGTGTEVPVVFSADLLIASFSQDSETHKTIAALAGEKLGEFFVLKPIFEKVIDDGKDFRTRADEVLGGNAPAFITACLQRKKGGIPKNKVSVEWDAALSRAAVTASAESVVAK